MINGWFICTLALFLVPAVLSGQELLAKIEPEKSSVQVGMVCSVNVSIDNVVNLGSFQFDLTFQTDIVEGQGVDMGDFLGNTGRNVLQADPDIDNRLSTGAVRLGSLSLSDQSVYFAEKAQYTFRLTNTCGTQMRKVSCLLRCTNGY